MNEPIAYFRGAFVPFSAAALSPIDAGFVLGATVAEQMRTFRGRLFRLEDHLARLAASLKIVGVEIEESLGKLGEICQEVASHNHRLLARGDDLGVGVFVTPGDYRAYGQHDPQGPLVCVHSYPLPFQLWHEKYRRGQALVIPQVRQVPAECWPSALKCRSRMHYYLADRQAESARPGARALLLDTEGRVCEASTANVLLFRRETGLLSPPHDKVLPGISLAEVAELAAREGISLSEKELTPAEVAAADEVFLTSTPLCLVPVSELDGKPIGGETPGPMFRLLIDRWSAHVGLDIVAQAERFSSRFG